jgi:uncharacterized membrane protein YjjP (DUF1212 family)
MGTLDFLDEAPPAARPLSSASYPQRYSPPPLTFGQQVWATALGVLLAGVILMVVGFVLGVLVGLASMHAPLPR